MISERISLAVCLLLSVSVGSFRVAEAADNEPGAEAGPSSSAAAGVSGLKASIFDASDDDEAQLRAAAGQFEWYAYLTVSGIEYSMKFGLLSSLEDAVANALGHSITLKRIEADDTLTTDKGQVQERTRQPKELTKLDFHRRFQEYVGHPCSDLKSLNALYAGVIAKYEGRKTNDYNNANRKSSGSTTLVIEELRDMAAICERIDREMSMELAFEKLRGLYMEGGQE